MNVNVTVAEPDRKVDCWNCGFNHFAKDCTTVFAPEALNNYNLPIPGKSN